MVKDSKEWSIMVNYKKTWLGKIKHNQPKSTIVHHSTIVKHGKSHSIVTKHINYSQPRSAIVDQIQI